MDPVPVTLADAGSMPSGGLVRCENGDVHRPVAGECGSRLDLIDALAPVPGDAAGWSLVQCRANADCKAEAHGYCGISRGGGGGGAPSVYCHYGCVRDAECAPDALCLCDDPVGRCVPAECRSDANCPEGVPCLEIRTYEFCTGESVRFTCGPECREDADCVGGIGPSTCQAGKCVLGGLSCGRPFLVSGEVRSATVDFRDGWAAPLAPDVDGLHPADRRTLARHDTEMGLMEHASIAAFARFSLDLLALGAPSDLVTLAAAAMTDETEHARLCFGLASAYLGAAVGPGTLELEGAMGMRSLEEQVRTTFLEACVGETCAAIEVTEAALHATDPAVASALHRIAADEARHAALGWRFVQWALGRAPAAARALLEAELRSMVSREIRGAGMPGQASVPGEERLSAHGVLPGRVRLRLRAIALTEVIAPCARALEREKTTHPQNPTVMAPIGRARPAV